MQAGFRVVVLALESQRAVDFLNIGQGQVAIGAVAGGPDDRPVASVISLGVPR